MGESLQAGRSTRARRGGVGRGPVRNAPHPGGGGAGLEGPDLAEVIASYQTPLLRYAAHIVERDEEAQDIVQETFLRYCRCVQTHGGPGIQDLSSWLFCVAHNLAQDALRRRGRERKAREEAGRQPAGAGEAEAVDQLIRQAACDRALAELKRLPEGHRQVLLLKIIQGLTLRQIARVTGLSFGNVAYRTNQGLKELARRLKEAGVI